MEAIVEELAALIEQRGWARKFQEALDLAASHGVSSISSIRTLDDYLRYIDAMVRWAPRESEDSRLVHDKLVEFYFLLDQAPLRELQSSIAPGANGAELTVLSQWIKRYAKTWGCYLDTTAFAAHIE